MQEAELKTNIPRQNISSCCRQVIYSAGNYYWCFKKDLKKFKIPIKPGRKKKSNTNKGKTWKIINGKRIWLPKDFS